MNPQFIKSYGRVACVVGFIHILTSPFCAHAASTALQMAAAMDIPTNLIVSASYTRLANPAAANVRLNWGQDVLPQSGNSFAVISTGAAADSNDPGFSQTGSDFGTNAFPNPFAGQTTCGGTEDANGRDFTELTVALTVPENAVGFSIKFKFYSAEYPENICSEYNDRFAIFLNSEQFNGNIALDGTNSLSINTVAFTLTNASQLTGTGMETSGAGTDWLTATKEVSAGEIITLRCLIFDGGDSTIDSLALIDGFRWLAPPVMGIERAVAIKWTSISNQLYQVQYTPAITTNSWTNLGGPVNGNGTTNVIYDSALESERLYRVLFAP